MKKISLIATTAFTALYLSGCGDTLSAPFIKTPNYTLGEKDGCATANGTYTKNSELFRNDPDYEKGWFAGRKHCNPSFYRQ